MGSLVRLYTALQHFLRDPVVRAWLFVRDASHILRDACDVSRSLFTAHSMVSSLFLSPNRSAAFSRAGAVNINSVIVPVYHHGPFVLVYAISNVATVFTYLTDGRFADHDALNYVRHAVVDTSIQNQLLFLDFVWFTDTLVQATIHHTLPHGKQLLESYHLSFDSPTLPPDILALTVVEDDGKCPFCAARGEPCACPLSFRERTALAVISPREGFAGLVEQYIHLRSDAFIQQRFTVFVGPFGKADDVALRRHTTGAREILVRGRDGGLQTVKPAKEWRYFNRVYHTARHDQVYTLLAEQLEKLFVSHASPTPTSLNVLSFAATNPTVDTPPPSSVPTLASSPSPALSAPPQHYSPSPEAEPPHARSFTCDTCCAEFKTKGNLQRHIRNVHERVRNIKCDWCASAYYQRADLIRHVRRWHPSRANELFPSMQDR